MFDSVNMHMPVVVVIVITLLAMLFVGFLIAVRVVGARIQDHEANTPQPDADGPGPTRQPKP